MISSAGAHSLEKSPCVRQTNFWGNNYGVVTQGYFAASVKKRLQLEERWTITAFFQYFSCSVPGKTRETLTPLLDDFFFQTIPTYAQVHVSIVHTFSIRLVWSKMEAAVADLSNFTCGFPRKFNFFSPLGFIQFLFFHVPQIVGQRARLQKTYPHAHGAKVTHGRRSRKRSRRSTVEKRKKTTDGFPSFFLPL